MASRQMAFQLGELQYRQTLAKIATLYDLKDGKMTTLEWLDAVEPDQRKRMEMRAVLVISVKIHKAGLDPTKVRKLICWRDQKGDPGMLEAQVDKVCVLAQDLDQKE